MINRFGRGLARDYHIVVQAIHEWKSSHLFQAFIQRFYPRPPMQRGMNRTIGILILVTGISLFGCATPYQGAISLDQPTKKLEAKHYQRMLKKHTRFASVLREFQTNLRIYVTFRSPSFEAAYRSQHEKLFSIKLAPATQPTKKEFVFMLAAATYDYSWNDFDAKNSQWQLTLENEHGKYIIPTSIKKIRITETERAFYPHLKMFYQLYEVRFLVSGNNQAPFIDNHASYFKFKAAGPLGEANVEFKLSANTK